MTSRKTRILHVIDSLYVGGAERVAVTLANLFVEKGYEVGILLINKKGPLISELNPDIRVYELNRDFKFNPFKMLRFSRIASRFDIIHVHMRYNLKYVGFIKQYFPFKAKVVFHDHWGDIKFNSELPLSLKYFLVKYPYIGVSKELTDWASSVANLKPEKIFLLRNIILQKQLKPNGTKSGDRYRLLLVSNFRRTKNIEFAVELLAFLNKRGNKPFELDIVGALNDNEREYFIEIKEKIRSIGLEDSISIITDCNEIQSILFNYDLAIHTATSESGPLVLMEYMAQGLPFVTYSTGEVVEQISNTFPDLICPSFDFYDWELRIKKIMSSSRVFYTEKLKNAYRDLFSSEAYFQKCQNIYQALDKNY